MAACARAARITIMIIISTSSSSSPPHHIALFSTILFVNVVIKFANVVIGLTGFFSGWAALHLDFQGRIRAGGAAWAEPVNPITTFANFLTTLTNNMVGVPSNQANDGTILLTTSKKVVLSQKGYC